MDRARLKTLILYHIYSSKVLVGILLLIMFVNLLLGIAFKHSINSAGSMDIASYIFAMFVGYELFREVFAFSMINGVSRKTYYISNILSTIIISVFLGVTTGVVSFISSVLANNSIMFYMIYPKNTANMFIWCTVMTYAIISLFHFISLVMYRISKKTKYIIILLLALSVPSIILVNNLAGGFIMHIQKFLFLFLGITGSGADITADPILSSAVLFVFSAVITAVSWFFLRKAEAR